jgi:hypothetical protein
MNVLREHRIHSSTSNDYNNLISSYSTSKVLYCYKNCTKKVYRNLPISADSIFKFFYSKIYFISVHIYNNAYYCSFKLYLCIFSI